MAKHPKCNVETRVHHGPYWLSGTLLVCSRHKLQYEESAEDFGPFNWKLQEGE